MARQPTLTACTAARNRAGVLPRWPHRGWSSRGDGHLHSCHTQANCAVARKLVARSWATITSGTPYQPRDLDGTPVTRRQAAKLAADLAVPDDVRRRTRAHSAETHRARLTH